MTNHNVNHAIAYNGVIWFIIYVDYQVKRLQVLPHIFQRIFHTDHNTYDNILQGLLLFR